MNTSYMEVAIKEAKNARDRGDYAFGAVVVRGDRIVASGGNRVKTMNDSTRHVELEVIQYAVGATHDRYLSDAVLYTTCYPCTMCMVAAYWSGIREIVYGISQRDLQEHGFKHGTSLKRYRADPLFRFTEAAYEVESLLGIKVIQDRRDECLALFNE